ncbi:MAG: hypothetical protein Q9191_000479 [Dirinaria sp. TL-2023a]
MARSIQDLPDEILVQIFKHLDISSLKSCRLTSRRWAASGSRWLFRRIYFFPRQEIMANFKRIAHEPAFAVGVEELIYDARMSLLRLIRLDEYNKQFTYYALLHHDIPFNLKNLPSYRREPRLGDIKEYPMPKYQLNVVRNHRHSMKMLGEEQDFLHHNGDVDVLSKGLEKFRHLRRITIMAGNRPDYTEPTVQNLVPNIAPDWFYKWSTRYWCHVKDESLLTAMKKGRRCDELDVSEHGRLYSEPGSEQIWDTYSLATFLKVASKHSPHITHFNYGSQSSPMPFGLLLDGYAATSFQVILENV